jgi:prepilin-type N-terminal cleavage/methylation domain-containing protein
MSRVRHGRGFTLLEMVVAIGLLAVISTMIFRIARSSLALATSIVDSQNQEMERQAFFDLLGRRFSSLPGNARIELVSTDSGSHYLSDLTLQNVPMAFTWGGEERIAKAVQLSTVKRRSGFLDIVLRYYDEEILEGSETVAGTSMANPQPYAEIVLLTDVAYFEWRALDERMMRWEYDWQTPGRLPRQLELVMSIGAQGEEMRHIFWIPPKQNPEAVMRQYRRGQSSIGGGGGKGDGGGEDDDAQGGPPEKEGSTGTRLPPQGGGQ